MNAMHGGGGERGEGGSQGGRLRERKGAVKGYTVSSRRDLDGGAA